ncbi:hypothetical protein ACOKFD_02825 [Flagellimonas sp. S174]|uniref:hypothetical protein n=1 Tax=Flagellimonas sp. S174 TaxID=3410790 RepID=UPI003BF535D0
MKKLILVISVLFHYVLSAQWVPNGNTITTANKVGIGTSAPVHLLHLKSTLPYVRFEMDTDSYSYLEWYESSTRYASIGWSGHQNPKRIGFFTNDGNSFAERMSITNGGNIGLGTTSPSEKLDVDGNIKILSANDRGIIFQRYADKLPSSIKGLPGEFSTRQGISFNTSSIEKAVNILWNGNVGIATDSPDAKLAVNGNIHTREVKVDLIGWPDYVFEKKYHLPSLQEVEAHIEEKGHLQDIPSAKEVKENGIKLGEMNSKLLQKIEELMLYTIQQQKEIELLKKQNIQLQNDIQVLNQK